MVSHEVAIADDDKRFLCVRQISLAGDRRGRLNTLQPNAEVPKNAEYRRAGCRIGDKHGKDQASPNW